MPVRRFTAWLTDEGEIRGSPLRQPEVAQATPRSSRTPNQRPAPAPSIAACQPPKGATPAEALRHRRDEAIVRLMLETGARAGEVVAMAVDDLDLPGGTAIIRRGKGGKGRVVPLGPHAVRAARPGTSAAPPPPAGRLLAGLWLGDRGKAFCYDALHQTLGARATAAAIEGFPPHRLRHTAAHRWLAAGGPRPASWPWPGGPAPTCCCGTPRRRRRPAPPSRPVPSTWGTCDPLPERSGQSPETQFRDSSAGGWAAV